MTAWKVVDESISDLVANNDIKEMTPRPYIVGYIVKRLMESGTVTKETAVSSNTKKKTNKPQP
jgi:hypothetical protein